MIYKLTAVPEDGQRLQAVSAVTVATSAAAEVASPASSNNGGVVAICCLKEVAGCMSASMVQSNA